MRVELAGAGFTECLNMVLVGTEDNYANLRRANDGRAVVIKNPMAKGVEVRHVDCTVAWGGGRWLGVFWAPSNVYACAWTARSSAPRCSPACARR